MEQSQPIRTAVLPVGIAFGLLAVACTFEAGAAQWMRQSQPLLGLVFAVLGLSLVGVHVLRRFRVSPRRDRG